LVRRLSGASLCNACEGKAKSERIEAQRMEQGRRQEAIDEYQRLLAKVWNGQVTVGDGSMQLAQIGRSANLSSREQNTIGSEAFRRFAEEAMKDDILSSTE
jgi:hypothetical protein